MSTSPPDADIAARLRVREPDALREAFDRHGGAVHRVARRVLGDDALAEDVTQDAFVALWNSPERFDPGRGTLRTYLLTMAHRRAIDVVRSEEARRRREQHDPDPRPIHIEDEVWARSLQAPVRRALATLTADEQDAVTLAYFGGLSYKEVAARLDTPEGTVKSRIRNGMKKLRSKLEELR